MLTGDNQTRESQYSMGNELLLFSLKHKIQTHTLKSKRKKIYKFKKKGFLYLFLK